MIMKPGWICVFVLVSTLPALAQSSDLEKRIKNIERRLEELESAAGSAGSSHQQDEAGGETPEATVELQELRRQVEILSEEVERVRSGERSEPLSPERARALGLGPSATRVYEKDHGVSLAGYGEMLYNNYANADQAGAQVDKSSQLDFLRAVLYAGYRFNDRILLNSEIEFEHASTEDGGEVAVEFAYLDFLVHPNFSLRGGLLLMPMGLINEYHEPNVYLGALRPQTERFIIPTTWSEAGFGATGHFGPMDFRAYVVNGFDATGFNGEEGLREGRQGGAEAKAEDFAFVGRLDVTPAPGILVGGSLYEGDAGQNQFIFQGRRLSVDTRIFEFHGLAQLRGWDLRALFARSHVGDAGALNLVRGLSGAEAVAERMQGGYVQAGFNLLNGFSESMSLTPYYRFESLDTQSQMPAGFTAEPSSDSRFHTFGLEFKPIYNVVIKGDYQWTRNEGRTGLDQFNLGLGYSF